MKTEKQINYFEWCLIFSIVVFLMCLSSCATIEKNMDSNYRAKNGLKPLPKKEDKKPALVKF